MSSLGHIFLKATVVLYIPTGPVWAPGFTSTGPCLSFLFQSFWRLLSDPPGFCYSVTLQEMKVLWDDRGVDAGKGVIRKPSLTFP